MKTKIFKMLFIVIYLTGINSLKAQDVFIGGEISLLFSKFYFAKPHEKLSDSYEYGFGMGGGTNVAISYKKIKHSLNIVYNSFSIDNPFITIDKIEHWKIKINTISFRYDLYYKIMDNAKFDFYFGLGYGLNFVNKQFYLLGDSIINTYFLPMPYSTILIHPMASINISENISLYMEPFVLYQIQQKIPEYTNLFTIRLVSNGIHIGIEYKIK